MAIPRSISNDVLPVTIGAAAANVVDLPYNGRLLCKTTAGNIVVTTGAGFQRTYPIAVGEVTEFYVTRVYSVAEGTTAVGLYLLPN